MCFHRQHQRVLVLVDSWTHHKHDGQLLYCIYTVITGVSYYPKRWGINLLFFAWSSLLGPEVRLPEFLSVEMQGTNQIWPPHFLPLKRTNGVCLQQSFAHLTITVVQTSALKQSTAFRFTPVAAWNWTPSFACQVPLESELLPLLYQTKCLCPSSLHAVAQPPVKQEGNFSFQLILLLICLEWSSSLCFRLEKKWTWFELHYKNFFPICKTNCSKWNKYNKYLYLHACSNKKTTLSYTNVMKPRVLGIAFT